MVRTHKDLEVWRKSMDFVTSIYKLTARFPDYEVFGLTSQIRRATVSIPSNIAEGAARLSTKEFVNFISIALGSASEVETQLIIAGNLGYINHEEQEEKLDSLLTIQKMLGVLRNKLRNKCR